MPHASDLLVRLVTLARDQHDVVRAGLADRARDRRGTIAFDPHRMRRREAVHDLRDDGIAVFVARIVVGDDHDVGVALGDRRHLRTLAAVALAATTEDAHQPTARMTAQRYQRLL